MMSVGFFTVSYSSMRAPSLLATVLPWRTFFAMVQGVDIFVGKLQESANAVHFMPTWVGVIGHVQDAVLR